MRTILIGLLVMAGMALLPGPASAVTAGTGQTFPVSWLPLKAGEIPGTQAGTLGMGNSSNPMSDNGRFVLFTAISNLLDPDGAVDSLNIYRRDMQTGKSILVSRRDGKNGAASGAFFYSFDLSANGNLAVMVTEDQLTADDADNTPDAFLRDIAAGTTTLITPGTSGSVGDAKISGDGKYIVFPTESALVPGDVNGLSDVYRRRLSDGTIDIVSRTPALPNAGNDSSYESAISGDGRWVAFSSDSTNLIAGFTDNNGAFGSDIYLRDMVDGVTYLVSSRFDSSTQGANGESEEPVIAGTPGALAAVKVAFASRGNNLVDNAVTDTATDSSVYLKTMPSQASELISRATGANGVNADSRAHTPSISNNGERVIFSSDAGNLGAGLDYYGVYVRDRSSSSTKLVSARNEYAVFGVISGNGSWGTWAESGGGTPDSDYDLQGVFRRNLNDNKIRYVSRPKGSAKVVSPGFSNYSDGGISRTLSANGRYMVFSTWSSRLPGGAPQVEQVYRRDLATGKIVLVSRATGAKGAISEAASEPSISGDGNRVAFVAYNSLDPADTNSVGDVYIRDISANQTILVSRADGPGGAVGDDSSTAPSVNGDGSVVAFSTEATNLGYGDGNPKVFTRDLGTNQTEIISRANGEAGATANNTAELPAISSDGSRITFASSATNLSPDDASSSRSIYLRDRNTDQTILISRAPGLAGASITSFIYDSTISPDGSRVAFVTSDSATVPATAPWPAFQGQIVVRTVADGTNTLASASPGGVVGDGDSADPSLNNDGSLVSFSTAASNIRTDVSIAGDTEGVVVKNLADGSTSGPPLFGTPGAFLRGARGPQMSANGNCLMFSAEGSNAVSGVMGTMRSTYIYVNSGTCQNPRALVPKLTKVSLKPFKFKVSNKGKRGSKLRFTLNTRANLTIRVDQKLKGRKVGKKCVKPTAKNKTRKACKRLAFRGKLTRKNRPAGKNTVAFSGRIGKKALRPGKYRVVIRASGPGGKSEPVFRSFRIVR
ncbi:MAG: PD40 domain-containing protein [Solirubrobacterales bacterium]|nr:PD40 domain-containing protein [Solirubrobacterales bacterium]